MADRGRLTLSDDTERPEALARGGADSPDFVLLALAYYEEGRYADAVRVLIHGLGALSGEQVAGQSGKQEVGRSGDREAGQLLLTRSLLHLGELERAQRVVATVLEARPVSREAHELHIELLLGRGLLDDALTALDSAAHEFPADPILTRLRDRAEARLSLRRSDAASAEGEPSGPEQWQDLTSQWGALLDVNREQKPDPVSDLREPAAHSPAIEIALPPLSDPLAYGMPPVPADAAELWGAGATEHEEPPTVQARAHEILAALRSADASQVPSAAAVAPAQEPMLSPRPTAGSSPSPEFLPSSDRGAPAREPVEGLAPVASAAPQSAAQQSAAQPGPGAALAQPPPVLSTRSAAAAPSKRVQPGRGERETGEWEIGEASDAAKPTVAARGRRSRRGLVRGLGALILLGALCVGLWWHIAGMRAVDAALSQAGAACWTADPVQFEAASHELVRVARWGRARRRIDDAQELLRAWRVLLFGAADGSPLAERETPWLGAASQRGPACVGGEQTRPRDRGAAKSSGVRSGRPRRAGGIVGLGCLARWSHRRRAAAAQQGGRTGQDERLGLAAQRLSPRGAR